MPIRSCLGRVEWVGVLALVEMLPQRLAEHGGIWLTGNDRQELPSPDALHSLYAPAN